MGSKEYTNYHFFGVTFLNLYNSVNMIYRLFKCGVVILDSIMEGTVSQIFYLDLS